ncbi:Chromatin structure-remodeling complex protein rsc9 [Cladophialophora chaetospira]|uniref:Chromatin structure-remodeling complex protein rsc9 n=1 Tax=Cladophialophora chaetospira TaxID=386627 RepID=A0AA38XI70_9EURO|nr:Chromatin structure-remodeling complex protein rsc9 [Cladophialophora chaetospira]
MPDPPRKMIEDEEEFLEDVAAFHEKRGTILDREGKVSGRPVSLHKLYKLVMERGGYDAVTAERMQWRTLVSKFGFGKTHEAVMTFQLKTVFYKNLAAYEIATYWGEEPPPKEILEDLSAKGGDLRTRTLANYSVGNSRTSIDASMADGAGESQEEEQVTPKKEKMESEEPGSASRYPTRQLRQDPKRTQIFQPDTAPSRSRSVRAADSPSIPPPMQPTYANTNTTTDARNTTFDWFDKYEPRQPVALTLRQVQTPGNDPLYYPRKAQAKAMAMPRLPPEPQTFLRQAIPAGMTGPNIYLRCLYGLRSGVQEEQDFALHHLVKVSYERGDKYKFEGFPFLAESLIEKALEITQLVYGIKWDVSYEEDDDGPTMNTLNAAFGTSNLLERIQTVTPRVVDKELETSDFSTRLEKMKEAVLVLRNMVILEENAVFLSKFPLFKDFLTVAASLPNQSRLTEYKQSALEITEQVTRYWSLKPKDPLYLSLLPYLEADDRSMLISALRSINRIALDTPDVYRLTNVPLSTVERLFSFTLLDDNELLEVSLDFLYAYTAIPENNTELLSNAFYLLPNVIARLTTLMLYQSITREENVVAQPTQRPPVIPAGIPIIPHEVHQHLLQFVEPERSSRWLRCCFEEAPQEDITQIAIWQAYQGKFAQNQPIPAADFIKNVSNTFAAAQAQVINGPTPRFIIKGIKPRRVAVDVQGRPLFKCMWGLTAPTAQEPSGRINPRNLCPVWHNKREKLWDHVMTEHLKIEKTPDGRFHPKGSENWICRWTHCGRRTSITTNAEIGPHMRMHIPQTAAEQSKLIHELANDVKDSDAIQMKHEWHYTAADQTTHPCGIPWMSVMILRNLARYGNKHGQPFEKDGVRLNERLFGAHKYSLFHVFSVSRTLRDYVNDLLKMIDIVPVEEEKRGVKREREIEGEGEA